MEWSQIIKEIIFGAGRTVLIITAILTPIMILIEILKDIRWLDRAAEALRPLMRFFTMGPKAAYPMVAGVFFGISFGSGVILTFAREHDLAHRDMVLTGLFLALCHGIIEDPLVFKAMGASWSLIFFPRILLAVGVLLAAGRWLPQTETPSPEKGAHPKN